LGFLGVFASLGFLAGGEEGGDALAAESWGESCGMRESASGDDDGSSWRGRSSTAERRGMSRSGDESDESSSWGRPATGALVPGVAAAVVAGSIWKLVVGWRESASSSSSEDDV